MVHPWSCTPEGLWLRLPALEFKLWGTFRVQTWVFEFRFWGRLGVGARSQRTEVLHALACRFQVPGFRVPGSKFRVPCCGLRVEGLG